MVYDIMSGSHIRQIGSGVQGKGNGQFSYGAPYGLAIDENTQSLFTIDFRRIQVLSIHLFHY